MANPDSSAEDFGKPEPRDFAITLLQTIVGDLYHVRKDCLGDHGGRRSRRITYERYLFAMIPVIFKNIGMYRQRVKPVGNRQARKEQAGMMKRMKEKEDNQKGATKNQTTLVTLMKGEREPRFCDSCPRFKRTPLIQKTVNNIRDRFGRFCIHPSTPVEIKKYFRDMETILASLSILFDAIDHNRVGTLIWDDFLGYMIDATHQGRVGSHQYSEIKDYVLSMWSMEAHFEGIQSMKYIPEMGKILSVCTKDIHVLETEKLKPVASIPLNLTTSSRSLGFLDADYMAYYKAIAASAVDNRIQFHDVQGTKMIGWLDLQDQPETQISLRYTEKHRLLAMGGAKGKLSLWRPYLEHTHLSAKHRFTLDIHNGPVKHLLWLPGTESHQLVTSGMDGMLYMVDAAAQKVVHEYRGHEKGVLCSAYKADHHFLISAGFEYAALVWMMQSPENAPFKLVDQIDKHLQQIFSVQALENQPQILTADLSGRVKIWDIRTFKCVQTIDAYREPSNMTHPHTSWKAFTYVEPDGYMALASRRKVWRFEYGEEQGALHVAAEYPIEDMCYCEANQTLLTMTHKSVTIWDVLTGSINQEYRNVAPSDISSVCVDPKGRKFFIGTVTGHVLSYNYTNGNKVHEWQLETDIVNMTYHDGSKQYVIATHAKSGFTIMWDNMDASVKNPAHHISALNIDHGMCVASSPRFGYFAVSNRNFLTLWKTDKDYDKIWTQIRELDTSKAIQGQGEANVKKSNRQAGNTFLTQEKDIQQFEIFLPNAKHTDNLFPSQKKSSDTVDVNGLSEQPVADLGIPLVATITCVMLIEGYQAVVVTDSHGWVKLFTLNSHYYICTLIGHSPGVPTLSGKLTTFTCLTFWPKEEVLYAGDDRGRIVMYHLKPVLQFFIRLFDKNQGSGFDLVAAPKAVKIPLLRHWQAHKDSVKSIICVKDPKSLIASASSDCKVFVWTLNGKKIGFLDQHGKHPYDLSKIPDLPLNLGHSSVVQNILGEVRQRNQKEELRLLRMRHNQIDSPPSTPRQQPQLQLDPEEINVSVDSHDVSQDNQAMEHRLPEAKEESVLTPGKSDPVSNLSNLSGIASNACNASMDFGAMSEDSSASDQERPENTSQLHSKYTLMQGCSGSVLRSSEKDNSVVREKLLQKALGNQSDTKNAMDCIEERDRKKFLMAQQMSKDQAIGLVIQTEDNSKEEEEAKEGAIAILGKAPPLSPKSMSCSTSQRDLTSPLMRPDLLRTEDSEVLTISRQNTENPFLWSWDGVITSPRPLPDAISAPASPTVRCSDKKTSLEEGAQLVHILASPPLPKGKRAPLAVPVMEDPNPSPVHPARHGSGADPDLVAALKTELQASVNTPQLPLLQFSPRRSRVHSGETNNSDQRDGLQDSLYMSASHKFINSMQIPHYVIPTLPSTVTNFKPRKHGRQAESPPPSQIMGMSSLLEGYSPMTPPSKGDKRLSTQPQAKTPVMGGCKGSPKLTSRSMHINGSQTPNPMDPNKKSAVRRSKSMNLMLSTSSLSEEFGAFAHDITLQRPCTSPNPSFFKPLTSTPTNQGRQQPARRRIPPPDDLSLTGGNAGPMLMRDKSLPMLTKLAEDCHWK